MPRSLAPAAVLVLAALSAGAAHAADDVISTFCEESTVVLDADHTASRLGRCGDQYGEDLLWHLDRIDQISPDLDGHFDRHNGGTGVIVYVMDTGVMATHDEFEIDGGTRVVGGYDATKTLPVGNSKCHSDNKALDPCYSDYNELVAASHGTSVASLVAGKNVGVAPNANIVSIRVMNERGLATTRTYLEGLDAIIRHAWSPSTTPFYTAVVNISGWVLERLAGRNDGQPPVAYAVVEKKMREMIGGIGPHGEPDPFGRKFLFVVAGNNLDGGCGRDGLVDRFPAILGPQIEGIITVGGMTEENSWWPGACRGGLEVLAPAHEIFSASITARDHYRGRNPDLRSGTSFAAPIISGIAARLLGERPDLTPRQLEAWITSTPSRIADPATVYADGKVAYTRPMPVARSVAESARLSP
ncbi:MAG: S8 family serine peptidase [Thermoanaerobaculia bacterium]